MFEKVNDKLFLYKKKENDELDKLLEQLLKNDNKYMAHIPIMLARDVSAHYLVDKFLEEMDFDIDKLNLHQEPIRINTGVGYIDIFTNDGLITYKIEESV